MFDADEKWEPLLPPPPTPAFGTDDGTLKGLPDASSSDVGPALLLKSSAEIRAATTGQLSPKSSIPMAIWRRSP